MPKSKFHFTGFDRPMLIPFGVVLLLLILFLTNPVLGANCGDCNNDGNVNVGDAVYLIRSIFNGGPQIESSIDADVNCDYYVNVGDVVFLINTVFKKGPAPCSQCPNLNQEFLFEIGYINFAWGKVKRGYFVDSRGSVFKYNYNPEDIFFSASILDTVTSDILKERYNHNLEFIGFVNSESLTEMRNLIPQLAEGVLLPRAHRCYDAGTMTSVAYKYDESSDKYFPILIEQCGDWAQKNPVPEAEILQDWLSDITGSGNFEACCY
ncbi:MAG: dockerin type I repeat-containing protein [candidate division Zixibacteria bacterium]